MYRRNSQEAYIRDLRRTKPPPVVVAQASISSNPPSHCLRLGVEPR